jgi:hypothetical protein
MEYFPEYRMLVLGAKTIKGITNIAAKLLKKLAVMPNCIIGKQYPFLFI